MSLKEWERKKEYGLREQLEKLAASDRYPFHMPGHKRLMTGIGNPYSYDITEIKGFDDLAEPNGILAELLEGLRDLYDAGEAFLSLNGSTGSNLVGFFAATAQHDEVLVAENCHRSIFHAAEIRECKVNVLRLGRIGVTLKDVNLSETIQTDIFTGVDATSVESAFHEHPKITTVIITSPTYEGIVSDVESIAKVVHAHGARLFVDAAHGAHFAVANRYMENKTRNIGKDYITKCYFPADPIALGADAMSVSLHKTLPMPGQTSLLLLPKEGGLSHDRVAAYWQIFMSSSPSYLLMAMIGNGLEWLNEHGGDAFMRYCRRLENFYGQTREFEKFVVLHRNDQDPGKIVILPKKGISREVVDGHALAARLLDVYAIDVELESDNHVIAMTSVMDTEEGFERLLFAIKEMDEG